MTTRSSRRATPLPVSPTKQAVMANVMGAGKATAKSLRKVLADKTNATSVEGLLPSKSPKNGATAVAEIKEEARTPCRKMRSVEQLPATPVLRGEDLLRSLVHSNLSIIQTPNGLSRQSPQAETPQFGVPLSPYQDKHDDPEAVVEVSTPSKQGELEVIDAKAIEASPESEVTSVSERLSSAWVGRDVDEVTEVGDDDDSDCSVLVNVSSPGMNLHMVSSPAPASIHHTSPQTADFKWQQRESQTVKESEQQCRLNYYEDEDYEGCDGYDGEDFGQVIDCDEICQGISRIKVGEGLPSHQGRHIRFNYNSDDEIDVEEVDVMRLRGLPTPRGKHLRFPEEL